MAKDKRKLRADFRKNRSGRARQADWTRADEEDTEGLAQDERISGKGELTRKRTVVGEATPDDEAGLSVLLDVDQSTCRPGRVLSMHGLLCAVEGQDGLIYQCATRRLLKTLATDQRHVVAAGDRVWFRPEGTARDGIIERIEPRRTALSRESRGRQSGAPDRGRRCAGARGA